MLLGSTQCYHLNAHDKNRVNNVADFYCHGRPSIIIHTDFCELSAAAFPQGYCLRHKACEKPGSKEATLVKTSLCLGPGLLVSEVGSNQRPCHWCVFHKPLGPGSHSAVEPLGAGMVPTSQTVSISCSICCLHK